MVRQQLYGKFAKYYDKIYDKLDHEKESDFIKWAVDKYKTSKGNKLLDIACGTGRHAQYLKNDFEITGVDISEEMLKIAWKKVSDVNFINGDMKKLDLGQKFDALICMFSAMNYNTSIEELKMTLGNFYDHLKDGGVLIFDLGLNKENWKEGMINIDTVVEDNLKVARISQSRLENGIFNSKFVFLVKENGNLDFDIDEHILGVFGIENVVEIIKNTGFDLFIYSDFKDEEWKVGTGERPVFVCVK